MRQLLAAEKNVQYITSVQKISASIDTAARYSIWQDNAENNIDY